jgi:hypothetical protein
VTDPLADRIAAAQVRLDRARAMSGENDDAQSRRDADLDAMTAEVDRLAASLGINLDASNRDADSRGSEACSVEALDARRTHEATTVDGSVQTYLETSTSFSAGLEEDRNLLVSSGVATVNWDEFLGAPEVAVIEESLRPGEQATSEPV